MKSVLATITLMMSLGATQAFAQIQLGNPSYGGTGCPAGSASVSLTPDQSTLTILFDQFRSEAGGATRVDQKACNIAIPVRVPQGYTVSIFKVDYRGYAFIPAGGRGRFTAEYFFAGYRGPRASTNFNGPYDKDYIFTNDVVGETLVWSACGADTNLRINTSLVVQTNRSGDQALATVDSADIRSGIIYHVRWKRC